MKIITHSPTITKRFGDIKPGEMFKDNDSANCIAMKIRKQGAYNAVIIVPHDDNTAGSVQAGHLTDWGNDDEMVTLVTRLEIFL